MRSIISHLSLALKTLSRKITIPVWMVPAAIVLSAATFNEWKQPGHPFPETRIGNQTWMAANLDIATFRNGDPIPEAKSKEEWIAACKAKQPAWCYYNNDPANGKKYGRMYNWYAVNDSRGLAPAGWHIPTLQEWIQFEKSVEATGAGILFECPDEASGFCANGGGYRFSNGNFSGLEEFIYLSGATGEIINDASGTPSPVLWGRGIHVVDHTHMRCGLGKDFGLYVRAVKDSN